MPEQSARLHNFRDFNLLSCETGISIFEENVILHPAKLLPLITSNLNCLALHHTGKLSSSEK